ncbi:glycoside hydrolase family 104 protein [Acinetobacter ursingii]|uniref:glycoside hydrolase family 24 protein n=1 Tax=Acinetobacter ursingii TaxID=108980 RepID=UPI003009F375
MATKQNYEKLLSAPNVQKMLDLIANAEGVNHGYNTLFGNGRFSDFSAHPNQSKQFTQTDGKKNSTTAAGRYQFLKSTWDGVAKKLGLEDFSPKNQDIAAVALLAENGALPHVLKGDLQTAVKKSGGTWASLPSSNYAQPKKSWDFINKQLGGQYQANSYEPEMVPKNMIAEKSNYEPELVPKTMMQTQQNLQQQVYEPELVPANMLT